MCSAYKQLVRRGCGAEIAILIMSMRRGGIIQCIPGVSLPRFLSFSPNNFQQPVIVYGFKDFRAKRTGVSSFE